MEKVSPATNLAQSTRQASDELLTRRKTCDILSIESTKYWELIKQGRLDVVRLGKRCTRVKRSSVDRLISGEGQ